MELRDNDEIYGTFDLIDTPVGRIVKSFIDAGVEWGISIRGAGDVDAEGNVYETFKVVEGAKAPKPAISPSKASDEGYKYNFRGHKKMCSVGQKYTKKTTKLVR